MGSEKQSGTTNTTTTPTPTAEETELNKLLLERMQAAQGGTMEMQQSALGLGNLLLQGQQLPGYLGGLPQGVTPQTLQQQAPIPLSAGTIGEGAIQDLSQKAIGDLMPQFQGMGLPLESGVAQSIAGRTAGDIRRSTYEGNLERQLAIEEYNRQQAGQTDQFNINTQMTSQYQNLNNLLNLLNLAVGGQAQIQAPVMQQQAQLSQNLAGLRTINQQGSSSQTTQANPFSSLMGGIGTGIGVFGALSNPAAGAAAGFSPMVF